MNFAPITEILEELKAGRIVVLVDDENRENEGDFVVAAEFVTPVQGLSGMPESKRPTTFTFDVTPVASR